MSFIDFTKSNLKDLNINLGNDENKAKLSDIKVIDKDWVKVRFMVTDNDLDEVDRINRYFSSANFKFTDSSLGGNIAINTRPQYTRYADIRIPGKRLGLPPVTVEDTTGNNGMGRYYSESLDDNKQIVYMEFGIAKFNSLFDFFTRAVDYQDSVLANTGRKPYMYNAGKFLGAGIMLAAFPLITVTIWTIKTVAGLISGHGAFNYYYLEPTMHNYWATVNTITTYMATELGLLIPEFTNDNTVANKMGVNVKINQDDLNYMKEMMPGIITDNNYIDVFAIATKAQAMANKQALYDKKIYDQKTDLDFAGYIKTKYTVSEDAGSGSGIGNLLNSKVMFSKYIDKVVTKNKYYSEPAKETVSTTLDDINGSPDPVVTGVNEISKQPDGTYPLSSKEKERTSKLESFVSALDSSVRDGGAYAAFEVEYTGSVTESFSNSVGEIETGGTLKSLSKKSKDIKFNLAGGNIVGETAQSIASGVKELIMGGLDSVTYGASNVLQTILGGGYIDIPKRWEDSSVNLPQITYKLKLISPYGNTISQMTNIYIPLAMLLAGTLPLATGKSSYTSPYLCSLFSKGVQKVKLGMVTNLTITRGTSNLGFNLDKKALAIDVSFTVTDFSNIISAPVNTSIFDEVFNVPLNDDTPLGNYISVIASRSLLDSKYTLPRVKLKLSRALMAYEQAVSPSSWGLRTGNALNGVLGGLVSQASILNK